MWPVSVDEKAEGNVEVEVEVDAVAGGLRGKIGESRPDGGTAKDGDARYLNATWLVKPLCDAPPWVGVSIYRTTNPTLRSSSVAEAVSADVMYTPYCIEMIFCRVILLIIILELGLEGEPPSDSLLAMVAELTGIIVDSVVSECISSMGMVYSAALLKMKMVSFIGERLCNEELCG